MKNHVAEFRRCLVELDVAGVRRLWEHVSPHLPQPKNAAEALISLHHARTQAESIPLRSRAYSHRWLIDNGLPSGLPDQLKPKAMRIYPRVVESVGISVNFRSPILQPITLPVRRAMEDAVSEAYADRKTETGHLRARMAEAKQTTIRKLVGKI